MATPVSEIYPQLKEMSLTANQLNFIENSVFDGKTITELIAEAESHNNELVVDDIMETEPISNNLMMDVRIKIESLLGSLPNI